MASLTTDTSRRARSDRSDLTTTGQTNTNLAVEAEGETHTGNPRAITPPGMAGTAED